MAQPGERTEVNGELRLAELLGALSQALDITEGQPRGHCVRCCWIGTHVGRAYGLSEAEIGDLYYTLLLKDAGCSSNAARLCQLYAADDRVTRQAFRRLDTQRGGDVWRFMLARAARSTALGSLSCLSRHSATVQPCGR